MKKRYETVYFFEEANALMKKEIREEIIKEEREIFIADDGKEFTSSIDCLAYEQKQKNIKKEIANVEKNWI